MANKSKRKCSKRLRCAIAVVVVHTHLVDRNRLHSPSPCAPSLLLVTSKCFLFADIEAQILELQAKKKEIAQTTNDKGVGLLEAGYFDSEFYDEGGADKKSRYDGYMTSIAANDDADEEEDDGLPTNQKRSYTAPKAVLKDIVQAEKDDFDPFADRRRPTVAEKEDEYRQKRRRLVISPDRADPFADGSYPVQ